MTSQCLSTRQLLQELHADHHTKIRAMETQQAASRRRLDDLFTPSSTARSQVSYDFDTCPMIAVVKTLV